MKAASVQARDRWRLAAARSSIDGQRDASDVSGTHAIALGARVGAERASAHVVAVSPTLALQDESPLVGVLREERDQLQRQLSSALAEVARLEAAVLSLTPPPGLEADAVLAAPADPGSLSRVVIRAATPGGPERLLELELLDDSGLFTGLEDDIARGGLFLATYTALEPGTAVQLVLEFSEGCAVEASGEVRWARDERQKQWPGLGVAFTQLSPEATAVLRDVCRAQSPRFYEV